MIRTLLFDMGNVLLHFSHEKMCEQMGALCGRTGDDLRRDLLETGRQLDFERGRYTGDAFHAWFEELAGQTVCRDSLALAASEIFLLNAPMLPILDGLKRHGYRLVLLSNTSVYHFEHVRRQFDILDRFDAFVLSYEAGAVKPEPAIFEAALRMIDCPPSQCFYTDDIPAYVETGRAFGLDAEVFTTAENLQRHLEARGVRWRDS